MEPSLICVLSYGLACSAPKPAVQADPAPAPAVAAADPVEEAAPPAAPGSASVILARVQAFYDGTKDLTAGFRQTHLHPVYGTKDVSKGKLRVKKPGMMHWDYENKSDPDFYADGSTLWMIERDTKQVVSKSVRGSDFAAAVEFLFGGRRLVEDFRVRLAKPATVKKYADNGHDVIELKPKKKNAHYKYLTLVVDRATGRVDSFVVRNGDDSTNHFVLSGIKVNGGLRASAFQFKVPKGYVLIKE